MIRRAPSSGSSTWRIGLVRGLPWASCRRLNMLARSDRPAAPRHCPGCRRSMMTIASPNNAMSARLRMVEEHVRLENAHNLDGIMGTFGETARYDDEPWDAHYFGRDEVRLFYGQLLRAMPDLQIDVQRRYATDEVVVLEVIIRGRHLGKWRGLPATGRQVGFPLCGIYTFDNANQLAGEKIYYDRATILHQLGVFHEPESLPGRISLALGHPITMARIVIGKSLKLRGLAKR